MFQIMTLSLILWSGASLEAEARLQQIYPLDLLVQNLALPNLDITVKKSLLFFLYDIYLEVR